MGHFSADPNQPYRISHPDTTQLLHALAKSRNCLPSSCLPAEVTLALPYHGKSGREIMEVLAHPASTQNP